MQKGSFDVKHKQGQELTHRCGLRVTQSYSDLPRHALELPKPLPTYFTIWPLSHHLKKRVTDLWTDRQTHHLIGMRGCI